MELMEVSKGRISVALRSICERFMQCTLKHVCTYSSKSLKLQSIFKGSVSQAWIKPTHIQKACASEDLH